MTLTEALKKGWTYTYRYDDSRVVVERVRQDGLYQRALAFDTTFDPWQSAVG